MEDVRARTREVTIVAHDPSVRDAKGNILCELIVIPDEELVEGPTGYRVAVMDFDASTESYYKPWPLRRNAPKSDPYRRVRDRQILGDPGFHCHNVYALVMRTLARFERALGRRIEWGFYGHQLKIAPHAFADANAFYSERDQALMFGYFLKGDGRTNVFTCLSHDVIVHETSHALLDGLRGRYTDPSSADQAAFHEGFADIVALLSVFSTPAVVERMLELNPLAPKATTKLRPAALTPQKLRKSVLFGLADEVGKEVDAIRGRPLRESLNIPEDKRLYRKDPRYRDAHRRGEILVAAMLSAFVNVWSRRLLTLGEIRSIDRSRVVEEGSEIADVLLTSAIRALDYTPPVDLSFRDYLSAFLTGDQEVRPDDEKYHLRDEVRRSFARYGIDPPKEATANGTWSPPKQTRHDRVHFEPMQRDFQEMFHFIWENREALELHPEGFTRVLSVRPVLRIGADGFALNETVCEYHQTLKVLAGELKELGFAAPEGMPPEQEVTLYGGGALIFDEYGKLKYHVRNPLGDTKCQNERLDYLWKNGAFRNSQGMRFANLHRLRVVRARPRPEEEW